MKNRFNFELVTQRPDESFQPYNSYFSLKKKRSQNKVPGNVFILKNFYCEKKG